MATWLNAKVTERNDWNDHLFSLKFQCDDFPPFKAGQFTKLGLVQTDGKILSRPYSLVNAPESPDLEIIAVPVEGGCLSPALHALQPGDELKVMSPATGFLILDEVPPSDILFLIATGTGIGPFLSILDETHVWQKYQHVVLVYGVRYTQDLAYQQKIIGWQVAYPERFSYVPVVSREKSEGSLYGRIPRLLTDGDIEERSRNMSPETSQVMICGNPDMIVDATKALLKKGLVKHSRRSAGQISMERYW